MHQNSAHEGRISYSRYGDLSYRSPIAKGYGACMNTPRDIKDRIFKRLLRHPALVRDMLSGFVPAAWLADLRLDSLRELPSEFITPRGDKRLGDVLWLADRAAGRRLLVMAEHQTAPDGRMAARMAAQTGMLYDSLRAEMRGPDSLFPALLPLVIYAGDRPWAESADLSATVEPSLVPIIIGGRRYLLLELERAASEHHQPRNRFWLLARLTFAASTAEATQLLLGASRWLDLADEDERRMLQDFESWFHALTPEGRPTDWDPDERRGLEEMMGRLTTLETNNRRAMERSRAAGIAQGIEQGIEQGVERQQAMLAHLAARRFGADWGGRLAAALRAADPANLDGVADLVLDCSTGEQLLNSLNGHGR